VILGYIEASVVKIAATILIATKMFIQRSGNFLSGPTKNSRGKIRNPAYINGRRIKTLNGCPYENMLVVMIGIITTTIIPKILLK
jgi:hypothetical protein